MASVEKIISSVLILSLCADVNYGHGVCKESAINGFWCHCDYGYSGENCITRANAKHL